MPGPGGVWGTSGDDGPTCTIASRNTQQPPVCRASLPPVCAHAVHGSVLAPHGVAILPDVKKRATAKTRRPSHAPL
jgi:hypothetical protein